MFTRKRLEQSGAAMRWVFGWLALAALAVALALLVGDNTAVVTLFWSPYRFDVSFNFVLFALIAAFVLLHLAMNGVAALSRLPAQARRWRSQQAQEGAIFYVFDALVHQLSGRFVRARRAAQLAVDQLVVPQSVYWAHQERLQFLAHLLLAQSAHALQNQAQRNEHLQAALACPCAQSLPQAQEAALLLAAQWATEDHDLVVARERLAQLPQGAARRIEALRIKLRAAQLDGDCMQALETARLLLKHRAFSALAGRSIIKGLALAALAQASDLAQLQAVWRKLDAAEHSMPEIILAAAQRAHVLAAQRNAVAELLEPEGPAQAVGLVRVWMEPLWAEFGSLGEVLQKQFVLALEPGLLAADGLERVERLQRQWPSNAFLQYLCGQACLQRQLWGKATLLLGQASQGLQDPVLLRRTWCGLALLAQERGEDAAAQAAWKKAAQIDLI